MATITRTYKIELSEGEAIALKNFLGSFNDEEFSKHGISGGIRQVVRHIWLELPDSEED